MIRNKESAYIFIRNEESDIKRFLTTFSYYATTYEKTKVIECKEMINFKISALNRKLSLQKRNSMKTIIEDEISFLKEIKRFVLRIQDFLFLTSKRFKSNDEFYILLDSLIHTYKKKFDYFKDIIQKRF